MPNKISFEDGRTAFYTEAIVAAITIVTLYLQTIVYSFHLGQVLYFRISITAIPLPSFFILLLPSFLIVIVILFLYQSGKIGTGVSAPLRKRLLIAMVFILLLMWIFLHDNLTYDSDDRLKTLYAAAPYYTDKTGNMRTGEFLGVLLCSCSPIIMTLLVHVMEKFVFRRRRNGTVLSIVGIVIFELLLALFNKRFQIMEIGYMRSIGLNTVMLFMLWGIFGCIGTGSVARTHKVRAYSGKDISVLVMLVSLIPLLIGFMGYIYAANLTAFKVFQKEQYPYAVVYENEDAYYCLRCTYERVKTGEEWYAPELDILYLIYDYELVIEKSGTVVETEKYDVVNLVDKYWNY